jgi:hypothetical protein
MNSRGDLLLSAFCLIIAIGFISLMIFVDTDRGIRIGYFFLAISWFALSIFMFLTYRESKKEGK